MRKLVRITDDDGTDIMILVDPAGLARLIQAARRHAHRRAGTGPFLLQVEGPAKPKEKDNAADLQK